MKSMFSFEVKLGRVNPARGLQGEHSGWLLIMELKTTPQMMLKYHDRTARAEGLLRPQALRTDFKCSLASQLLWI